MHTHIHTYTHEHGMHTGAHAYMRTYIQISYRRTCIHTWMHTGAHAYTHTYIHAHGNACMHVCSEMRAYMAHAYTHTCTWQRLHGTCIHTYIHKQLYMFSVLRRCEQDCRLRIKPSSLVFPWRHWTHPVPPLHAVKAHYLFAFCLVYNLFGYLLDWFIYLFKIVCCFPARWAPTILYMCRSSPETAPRASTVMHVQLPQGARKLHLGVCRVVPEILKQYCLLCALGSCACVFLVCMFGCLLICSTLIKTN